MNTPLISIITATYNRSNVLRYTIECVRQQTLTDWELIVVSDASTDDTADVVASFGDSRIRFVELERNHGEQSEPNNVGLKMARGKFIAFVNHDDLWMPNHLQASYSRISETGADVVFGVGVHMRSATDISLIGQLPPMGFKPVNYIPASCWFFRHELIKRVGNWYSYRDSWLIPSLDWLVRAYRLNATFASSNQITLLFIVSTIQKDSYKYRLTDTQQELFGQMQTNPHFREQLLTTILLNQSQQQLQYPIRSLLAQAGRHLLYRILILSDYRLMPLWFMLKFRRKGGVIDYLRKERGLSALKTTKHSQSITYHERLAT